MSFIKALASRAGDLTKTIEYKSKDEFGELSISFNHMINSLRDIIVQIRDTVAKAYNSSQGFSASSQEVSSSIQEISLAMQRFSKGANEQLQKMEAISVIMGEMSLK